MRQYPDDATELRGIEKGMCLAAAILVRDFDSPTLALEILGAAGVGPDEVKALGLDDYDAVPIVKILADDERMRRFARRRSAVASASQGK